MDEQPLHRRRQDDMPAASDELILYQLGELKAAVREGFQKMEGRFDRVEDRLTSLERFRERVEQRNQLEAQSTSTINARWVPLLIAGVTIVVTVIMFLVGNGGPP